jgi:predicted lactoylglutathione lyase
MSGAVATAPTVGRRQARVQGSDDGARVPGLPTGGDLSSAGVPLEDDGSPYGYPMTRRIERAMALLRRGDLSVTEVCFVAGCSPLGTFSTRFTELVGVPPSACRRCGGDAVVHGETGDQTGQESRSAGRRAPISVTGMASIESVILEVADPTAADRFYTAAFGLGAQVRLRASVAPTTGFRGFTLSLTVSQPATVSALIDAALDAGATPLKPAAKSFWGYGGVVQAPDGTIWKVATSAKKDTGPVTRQIDEIVLLLGVADVAASKRFYVDRGLSVAKSFGRKYVEFATPSSPVKLALYGRRALAKDAGVSADGTGSHRLMIGSDAGPFTDPDGFVWEPAGTAAEAGPAMALAKDATGVNSEVIDQR